MLPWDVEPAQMKQVLEEAFTLAGTIDVSRSRRGSQVSVCPLTWLFAFERLNRVVRDVLTGQLHLVRHVYVRRWRSATNDG